MREHRARNQHYCRVGGRVRYLGPIGSAVARERFLRVLEAWRRDDPGTRPTGLLVAELAAEHVEWMKREGYSRSARLNRARACALLTESHGAVEVERFGPLDLRDFKAFLVARGFSRDTINSRLRMARLVFRWGVEEGLVPPAVFNGLSAIRGVRVGKAPGKTRRRPVPDELVEATLPHLPPVVADMVRVQRLTGMRPGEVCAMRWEEIDRDRFEGVWLFSPRDHKTAHREHVRVVVLGPRAVEVLKKHERRAGPVFVRRKGRGWRGSAAYRRDSYRGAIARACKGAGLAHWFPHLLRHSRGTEVRREAGLEGAGAVLGHASLAATEVYAERDVQRAVELARRSG